MKMHLWKDDTYIGPITVVTRGKKVIRGTVEGQEKPANYLCGQGYVLVGDDWAQKHRVREVRDLQRTAAIREMAPALKKALDTCRRFRGISYTELAPPIAQLSDERLGELEAAIQTALTIFAEVKEAEE